jgi:hypothetical protein
MRSTHHVPWPAGDRGDWPLTIAALAREAARPGDEAMAGFLAGLFPSLLPSRIGPAPCDPPSVVARREWEARLHAELSRPTPDLWYLRDLMGRGESHLERLRASEREASARPSRVAAGMTAGFLIAMLVPILCGVGIAVGSPTLAVAPALAWVAASLAFRLRGRTGPATAA